MLQQEIERQFREYDEILRSQDFVEDELDYGVLDYHLPMLQTVDVIESGAMYVIDLYKRGYVYMSPRFYRLFGFDVEEAYSEGPSFLDRRVHPEDFLQMLRAGNYFMRFGLTLPVEDRKAGRLVVDYRIRNAREEYVRVIKQHTVLELDGRGNIWLALCLVDISPDTDLDAPFRCRAVNGRTGELYNLPDHLNGDAQKPQLSNREVQVLQLIADGLVSKQIADRLFISVNTVNTHRQRIIEKLNVGNTFEALTYAAKIGLLK